ncbi:glycosyltransferase [Lutibacter sp. HS1-25]|uniref:glycosyltransferase family 4 protein n=1 Tax=Lutibacter sp. HS1-25 TaxID=2485000 RepID=UPI001012A042|nr:glycosyltransferase family 4 protein [Lutibacter sp. HS1-25]RXP45920.1 glycosyltransferase [Lutibacter sp. HS1-25]
MILIIGPLPDPIDGCSFANKTLCKNLKHNNIKFEVINTNTNLISSKQGSSFSIKKALYFFKSYFSLYKIPRAKVVYFTPGQTFFGLLKYAPFIILCILLKKPYVIHVHGNHLGVHYQSLKGVKKQLFHFLISKASAGIVLSKSLKDNFKDLLPLDDIFVVENFAGNDIYKNTEELIKRTDIPRIIYLSNLMAEKGILDLLDALIILDKKGVNYKAIVAGAIESSIKMSVISKLEKLGNKVNYVGVVQGQEKIEALIGSNIFILPTFYKMEGQPISILEALATGNIIVTTNHAGIPDIITSKNGYLLDPQSPEMISKVITNINEKLKEEVRRFSEENMKYAKNNFKEDIFSSKIIEILNSVSK